MIVKAKEREEIYFKDVKEGQVFKQYADDSIYMKVGFEDDSICCPRCDEDIHISEEKGMGYAVELNSGLIYDFDTHSTVEIIQGTFIEE